MNPKCNFKHPTMHMMGNQMGGYMNMMPYQQFPMGGMMNPQMMRNYPRRYNKFKNSHNHQVRNSSENVQIVDPDNITNLNS